MTRNEAVPGLARLGSVVRGGGPLCGFIALPLANEPIQITKDLSLLQHQEGQASKNGPNLGHDPRELCQLSSSRREDGGCRLLLPKGVLPQMQPCWWPWRKAQDATVNEVIADVPHLPQFGANPGRDRREGSNSRELKSPGQRIALIRPAVRDPRRQTSLFGIGVRMDQDVIQDRFEPPPIERSKPVSGNQRDGIGRRIGQVRVNREQIIAHLALACRSPLGVQPRRPRGTCRKRASHTVPSDPRARNEKPPPAGSGRGEGCCRSTTATLERHIQDGLRRLKVRYRRCPSVGPGRSCSRVPLQRDAKVMEFLSKNRLSERRDCPSPGQNTAVAICWAETCPG